MSTNLLRNGDFEADWSQDKSHHCWVFPTAAQPYQTDVGNIFSPPGWTTWFLHEVGVWSQPEVRDAWITGDARRVHSGQKAILLFTFFRKHDAGFLQQVQVSPGTRLRLSAWAHAWSNHEDAARPTDFPHPDDPRWSEGEGVGYNEFFAQEGTVTDDAARNFTFQVGIDPTGGLNPFAGAVVWGKGVHIYNAYRQTPAVEAVAQGSKATIFLRSRGLWPYKHSDAYWDDALLEVVGEVAHADMAIAPAEPKVGEGVQVTVTANQAYQEAALRVTAPDGTALPLVDVRVPQPPTGVALKWEFVPAVQGKHRAAFTIAGQAQPLVSADVAVQPKPPQVRGWPREQYARTYVLLPPGAGLDWVQAILDSGAWDRRRWTIGGSADDAGIGALEDKTVIGVNPGGWPSDLAAFFQQYYPGTRYVPLTAANPEELKRKLQQM
jgi:hypothetical protein